MAAPSLTVNSVLQCPHGGQVQIIPSNTRAKADGGLIATAGDQFMISGCPFTTGGTPMPCLTVNWSVTDVRTKAGGNPTLSHNSVGLCLNAAQAPQGPVTIVSTQMRTKST